MDANAEKRVALARDVIAQLDAKSIVPEIGIYCAPDRSEHGKCNVCALGALMVACCGPKATCSVHTVIACLEPVFTEEQIILIEAAFEGNSRPPSWDVTVAAPDVDPAALWLGDIEDEDDHNEAEARMRAIMESI